MATPTYDYQTQIGQLSNQLVAHQEMTLTEWCAKCPPDETLGTHTNVDGESYMDQLPALLTILTERIRGLTPKRDPVELAGQYARHRWQRGYALTEMLTEFNRFYDIFAEEIQQLLARYPQTQPQVIIQAYAQLLQLSKDISLGSVQTVDQLRIFSAVQPVQTRQVAPDSLHPLTRGDQLQQTAHDARSLRNHLHGYRLVTRSAQKRRTGKIHGDAQLECERSRPPASSATGVRSAGGGASEPCISRRITDPLCFGQNPCLPLIQEVR